MRILLDECVPRRLRRELIGHDVRTVPEMGWSDEKDGDLLRAMIGHGFEVLVTVDRNLRHQQDLPSAGVALIVLVAASNRLVDLVPLMSSVRTALGSVAPGDIVEITA